MPANEKILVTGATGFTGREVVKQLTEVGANVVAGLRDPEKAKTMEWWGAESVLYDYTEAESVAQALTGIDKVFFVTPAFDPDCVRMAEIFVEQAKRAGVRHIVRLSEMDVENKVSQGQRQMEGLIEDSGLAYTHLRPNFFMQNFNTYFLDGIKEQRGIFLPAGEARISLIDIRDIAAVAVVALTTSGHEGQAYTLTGAEALSHAEIADVLSQQIGEQINYLAMSDADMTQALSEAGWPDSGIQHLLSLFAVVRAGNREPLSDAVSSLLGREPIRFQQYVADYLSYW